MKQGLALLSLLLAVPAPAREASSPAGCRVQSLDGRWAVVVDPYETGFYDYRRQERSDGIFLDLDWKKSPPLVEYDFDRSPTLDVPGDWNSQREELKYYEGTVW